ncbi:MAG: cation-translocating P-type ATPase [Syntrophobacteraceae bacterium]|nr:cation-translocating P-type ATPase [Syntrophobacteraceae bacterium]
MSSFQDQQIRVCHSVPGRLRLKSALVRESEEMREALRRLVAEVPHLTALEVRSLTGSIVVLYDPLQLHPDGIMDAVARALRLDSRRLPVSGPSRWLGLGTLLALPRFVLSLFMPGRLRNVVTLSLFLGGRLVGRWVPIPLLSPGPAGLTSAVAALGSLSLCRLGIEDMRRRATFGLYPFLAAACGLAILLGEALTALEILWVLSIGAYVERLITERSRKAISDLLRVAPDRAYVLVDGAEVETPVHGIRPGDTVAIHEGEWIAVDGRVVGGSALVDEAHISGRADPRLREAGDPVYAGTRVIQGHLLARAEKVGDDTYLSRILKLVEDSLGNRADVERKADQLAGRLVRFGGLATAVTLVATGSLTRSLSVLLVMSCPCATVLATSTALAAAMARGARRGILIKGGLFLEKTREVDTLVFDKTGTITLATPEVLEVIPRAPWQDPSQVLAMAAGAETGSPHPVAAALLNAARKADLPLGKPVEVEVRLGRGLRARLGDDVVLVGNGAFMADSGVDPSYFRARALRFEEGGGSVVYVARNGRLQGMIVLENALRPHCADVVAGLREQGIRSCALVSGDSGPTVRRLAHALGFEDHRAELLPEEKAQYVRDLQASGARVMMVGDGLNDALALSEAHVGVAMGAGGSEVAIEAADVALLNNNLEDLPRLLNLSRAAFRVIEQNFRLATLTNVAGAGLGAFGLITPVLAGLLHAAHSLGIMINSSRLLAAGLDPPGEKA